MARILATNRIKIRGIDTVMKFNGISDFVDLGASGPIAGTPTAFSLSSWFKRDKATGLVAMVGDITNTAQNHFNFQTQGAGKKLLSTLITNNGAKALVGASGIPQFIWGEGVLSYDGANISFYYNGLFDSTTTHTGTIAVSTGMMIGTGSAPIGGAFRYFGGNMANVRYWDRAITATEVSNLYFEDIVPRTQLQGEWLLGGNALDTAGTNNGTVTGTTYDTIDVPLKVRPLASGRVISTGRILIT